MLLTISCSVKKVFQVPLFPIVAESTILWNASQVPLQQQTSCSKLIVPQAQPSSQPVLFSNLEVSIGKLVVTLQPSTENNRRKIWKEVVFK